MTESFSSSPEKREVAKSEVIDAIRAKGITDPDVMNLVIRWTEQEEEKVARENTSKAAIMLNIERVDLYVEAGDIDGAIQCLEQARYQAEQEREEGLLKEIELKLSFVSGLK